MARTKDYFTRKATETAMARIPTPVLDAAGRAVLKGVDKAVESRWDRALERAAEAEGDTVDERVRSVARGFTRELTSVGVATGATAAAPAIGTAGALSAVAADITWFAVRATDLIMTIGAIHGRVEATVEERRAWVLSILAFGEQAAEEFLTLAGEAATVDALRRINTALAAKVVKKYGSRKGILSIGKLLPFGIGAVVGGSANWAMTRALVNEIRLFFDRYHLVVLPPPPSGPPLPPPPGA